MSQKTQAVSSCNTQGSDLYQRRYEVEIVQLEIFKVIFCCSSAQFINLTMCFIQYSNYFRLKFAV